MHEPNASQHAEPYYSRLIHAHPESCDVSCASSATDEDASLLADVDEPLLRKARRTNRPRNLLTPTVKVCCLIALFATFMLAVAAVAVVLAIYLGGRSQALTSSGAKPVIQEATDLFPTLSTLDEASLAQDGWELFDAARAHPRTSTKQYLDAPELSAMFTDDCADLWTSEGRICDAVKQSKAKETVIDAVWTWVAENEYWSSWRSQLQENPFGKALKTASKMFRSHHQLKYSIRSVLENLPHIDKLHLVTSDLPACQGPQDCSSRFRVGQIPIWLDQTTAQNRVQVQHHWDVYKSFGKEAGHWRNQSLPVFNSLAIESQLSHVNSTAQALLYVNDDSYITVPMAPADVATPLLGPVFRMQRNLLVAGEAPGTSTYRSSGEWPSMTYANWLLDQRFGKRQRPYLVHQAKVISAPLLEEVAHIWAQELDETGSVRFRGKGNEVNTLFLATHYVLERHRESLLWSYFVARMDSSGSGTYSSADRRGILEDLRTAPNVLDMNGTAFRVYRPERDSPVHEQAHLLLQQASLAVPLQTAYVFSSVDGYALTSLGQGPTGWPIFTNDSARPRARNLDIARCFGSLDYGNASYTGDVTSAGLFKRVAFEKPDCGDIVVAILLGRSGRTGLEAFLPLASQKRERPSTMGPSMLGGLAKSWQEATFSAESPSGSGRRRIDTVHRIQKYSYVIGDTDATLVMMRSSLQTLFDLQDIEARLKNGLGPALVTLNDDIMSQRDVPAVDHELAAWHNRLWPNMTAYELPDLQEASPKTVFDQITKPIQPTEPIVGPSEPDRANRTVFEPSQRVY